jgi:hypothetical protein
MNYPRLFQRILEMTLVLLLLAACGGKTASPDPGASFSGTINVGDKAGSGALSFSISGSGTELTNLSTSLQKANCQNMITMGSVSDYQSNPGIPINRGAFEGSLPAMGGMVSDYRFSPPGNVLPTPVPNPETVGRITGRFTSAKTASGTITIYLGAPMTGGVVCELGTFDWSATAK